MKKLLLLPLLLAGCGDATNNPEMNETEAALFMDRLIQFEDKASDLRTSIGEAKKDDVPEVTLEPFMVGSEMHVALRVSGLPPSSFRRYGFGAEFYYDPLAGLEFQEAFPSSDHHWTLFGSTPRQYFWTNPETGDIHFRVAGIAVEGLGLELDNDPTIATLKFGILDEGALALYKTDNRETTGWLMMDGTDPLKVILRYHGKGEPTDPEEVEL